MSVGTLPPHKGALTSSRTSVATWFIPALKSTVGSKFLMAITGTMLVGFVIAHLTGNLLIYKGPDAINRYARGLKDLGPLLWVARGGLLATFLLHMVLAIRLTLRNHAARPERYRLQNTVQATLASRTMILSGLVILAFVIFHVLHLATQVVLPMPESQAHQRFIEEGIVHERHHVYNLVVDGFSRPAVSIAYIFAQLVLWLHLSHGISSVFQSLGLNSPRFWPLLKNFGFGLATLLALGNISIPVAVLLKILTVAP